MKKFCLLICFLFCLPSLFAADNDLELIQRNMLELQQQFWNLEKILKDNSEDFHDTVVHLQSSAQELRDNQAALNAKLESVLNQMQALNEKLDETNRRIKELSVARTPIAPPSIEQPSSRDESAPPTRVPGEEATGQVGDQQMFQAARAEYTKGNYEQALRSFQDLLDQDPNSPLADDAQFMIGESYYGMKEYVDAVTEYDKLIKEFSDSDHVPGARLKKAFSLQSLGKRGQAVMELQTIVARYPNTKEAQIARQRLEEFGLE